MGESALDLEAIKRRLDNVPEFVGHIAYAAALRDVTALIAEVERLRASAAALEESNRIFEQNSADAVIDHETVKAMIADIQSLQWAVVGGNTENATAEVLRKQLVNVLQWANASQMHFRRQAIAARCHVTCSAEAGRYGGIDDARSGCNGDRAMRVMLLTVLLADVRQVLCQDGPSAALEKLDGYIERLGKIEAT